MHLHKVLLGRYETVNLTFNVHNFKTWILQILTLNAHL